METSKAKRDGFPLLICGLPRSGTSFLFAVLSTHPAFVNNNFKDKELRYFEKILGNRPWGTVDGVSQRKFAEIDRYIMPELLRSMDGRLRELRGGPAGHYLNANPRDVFYSEIILDALPEAKFIVALRDPLSNVWSALNYPTHTWGKREGSGFFSEEDVRRTAEHWNKVASHILRHDVHARPESFLILEQERLAGASPQLHAEIEAFIGLPGIGAVLEENASRVIHSSFVEDSDGTGRDRLFDDPGQKLAHFRSVQGMFAESGRYASMVLDICGRFVEQLSALGLMQQGPSLRLIGCHGPLPGASDTATLRKDLYRGAVRFLLQRLDAGKAGSCVVAGAVRSADDDLLAAYLRGQPERRAIVVESLDGLDVSSSPLDVLQIDCGADTVDAAMGLDLVALHPRLILLPAVNAQAGERERMQNVFVNLGYLCVDTGDAFIAARRDWLDEDLARDLRLLQTAGD